MQGIGGETGEPLLRDESIRIEQSVLKEATSPTYFNFRKIFYLFALCDSLASLIWECVRKETMNPFLYYGPWLCVMLILTLSTAVARDYFRPNDLSAREEMEDDLTDYWALESRDKYHKTRGLNSLLFSSTVVLCTYGTIVYWGVFYPLTEDLIDDAGDIPLLLALLEYALPTMILWVELFIYRHRWNLKWTIAIACGMVAAYSVVTVIGKSTEGQWPYDKNDHLPTWAVVLVMLASCVIPVPLIFLLVRSVSQSYWRWITETPAPTQYEILAQKKRKKYGGKSALPRI